MQDLQMGMMMLVVEVKGGDWGSPPLLSYMYIDSPVAVPQHKPAAAQN